MSGGTTIMHWMRKKIKIALLRKTIGQKIFILSFPGCKLSARAFCWCAFRSTAIYNFIVWWEGVTEQRGEFCNIFDETFLSNSRRTEGNEQRKFNVISLWELCLLKEKTAKLINELVAENEELENQKIEIPLPPRVSQKKKFNHSAGCDSFCFCFSGFVKNAVNEIENISQRCVES